MKKKIAAAFLISASLLAAPVWAEEPADTEFSAELTEVTPVEAGAFLVNKDFGGGLRYAAYPLEAAGIEEDVCSPLGQIRLDEGGLVFTADVVNFSIPEAGAPTELQTLFGENGRADLWGKLYLATANEILANAQTLVNQKILDTVEAYRKKTGDPIPYSIAHVDFRSVEPIQRMDYERTVYTASTRVLMTFDGWQLPMYVKAYLYKEGDAYRVIGLMTSDSQKGAAMEGGEAIVSDLMK